MTAGIEAAESCRVQRLNLPEGGRTWTVMGRDHRVVEPAEEYLEFLRAQRSSPHKVKSYARGLALWWQYLDVFDPRWDAVKVADFGAFLTWLRTGDEPGMASIEQRPARFAESTIWLRLGAVMSCYDYHLLNGVEVGRDLHRISAPRQRQVQAAAGARRPPTRTTPVHGTGARGSPRRAAAGADAGTDRVDLRRLRQTGTPRLASGAGRSATGCCGC